MGIQQDAQKDSLKGEKGSNDPSRTWQEKEKYDAAFNAAEKKEDQKKK